MNCKLSENLRDGAFPDEETFEKIYSECLENAPQASENVRNAYSELNQWLEKYICAIQEDTFRYAYQCGYEAGQKDNREHTVQAYLVKGGVVA